MILYPRTISYWQYRRFNITDSANIYWMHSVHKPLCCAGLSRSVVSDSLWPMDCSPPGSPVHVASPGKNTGVGCHVILQGIFPTQGLNPGLPHCRWILYQLSHEGSPRLEWVTYLFSRGSSWPRNRTRVSCIAGDFFFFFGRWLLYQLSYQGSPTTLGTVF